jgi:uncharacterized protein YraI
LYEVNIVGRVMIRLAKGVIVILAASLLSGSLGAAQVDLNSDKMLSLKKAYRNILDGKYSVAQELYQEIQVSKDVAPDLKRAAIEGEGLALLLQLNKRIEESKSDTVKARLIRFRRRNTVDFLKTAAAENSSETLAYMHALAKEEEEISEKTFEGLKFSDEYARLTDMGIDTPIAVPKKPVVVSRPNVKFNDEKIPGARTTPLKNVQYKAKGSVSVRSGPGTNYTLIASLVNNQVVTAVKSIRLSNGQVWLKLQKNTRIGYASAKLFTKVKTSAGARKKAVDPLPVTKPIVPKTVVAKPAAPKKPVAKRKSASRVNPNNKACSGGRRAIYSVRAKVPVLAAPNGPVIFSYNKNIKINIVGEVAGHLVIRIGQSSGNFKCGYIKNDKTALKKNN